MDVFAEKALSIVEERDKVSDERRRLRGLVGFKKLSEVLFEDSLGEEVVGRVVVGARTLVA